MVYSDDPERPGYRSTSPAHGGQPYNPASVHPDARRRIEEVAARYPNLDARGVYDELKRLRQKVSLNEVLAVLPPHRR